MLMGQPADTSSPAPIPSSNPVERIQRDFGFGLPGWLVAVLTVAGAIAALWVLYKPLGELARVVWQAAGGLINSSRSHSKRARRRALFADHLESAMRRLGEKEEWRDSRFAELEAEVEFERESTFWRFRRLVGGGRATSIRTEPSLTAALRGSRERLIVLEGDPGAGKSVALRHLAQRMAAAASRRPSERSVLPIYVNLKTFRPPSGHTGHRRERAGVRAGQPEPCAESGRRPLP